MHWNSIRYCIGFPPEIWYDIADEEGFLIQDEFPIWLLGKAPENPTAEKIIPEYTEWMRERWNHPCVVIWDAQNESHTAETGKAISGGAAAGPLEPAVGERLGRAAEPDRLRRVASLPVQSRLVSGKATPFRLKDMANVSGMPALAAGPAESSTVPIIINEYDWLWLNRDGTPTCLTDKVYESLLGPNSTAEQRRDALRPLRWPP